MLHNLSVETNPRFFNFLAKISVRVLTCHKDSLILIYYTTTYFSALCEMEPATPAVSALPKEVLLMETVPLGKRS